MSKNDQQSRPRRDVDETERSDQQNTPDTPHTTGATGQPEDSEDENQQPPSEGNGGDGNGGDGDRDGNGTDPSPPSDPDLQLLTFLWLLEQRTNDITGFRAKRFYAETVGEQENVGKMYAKLKGDYIASRRDTEPFTLTPTGRNIASDAAVAQEDIIDQLATEIASLVQGDELFERLFWLAHVNTTDYKWYLDHHKEELSETAEILVRFFTDERFQSHPEFGATLDALPDIESEVQDTVLDLITDEAHLKGLAVLEGEAVIQLLQFETNETLRVGGPQAVLEHYTDSQTAEDVLNDFYYEGLSVEHNVFNVSIDRLIEQHQDTLRDWLQFDQSACRNAFENHWDLILEAHHDFVGRTDAMVKLLADVGAVVPIGNKFAVRAETADTAQEVIDTLQNNLSDRLEGFSNATFQLFHNFDDVMECDEEILVVLHENSWSSNQHYYPALVGGPSGRNTDRNSLTEKVILVPSPKEFGFEDPHLESGQYHCHGSALEKPDSNLEFNALGEVAELEAVKTQFNQKNWKTKEDDGTVRAAAKYLEEESRISVEEAFEAIAEHDDPYVVALYTIAAKATTKTSRNTGAYDDYLLWRDVRATLLARYDSLSEDDVEEIQNNLEDLLAEQAGLDLVDYTDIDQVHKRFADRLRDDINQNLNSLSPTEEELLYVFLTRWRENTFTDIRNEHIKLRNQSHQPEFDTHYWFAFNEQPPSNTSLEETLTKSGICTIGTYVDSYGERQGDRYTIYRGVQNDPDRYLSKLDIEPTTPSLDALTTTQDSIPQLVGIEYLLDQDGSDLRTNLRDRLLSIDDNAMREFEYIDGIIAENDNRVILNPTIQEELEDWVTDRKRALIGNISQIKNRIRDADYADFILDYDRKNGIFEGTLLTKDREEIQVIVAPWLTDRDADLAGRDAIIVLTADYGTEFIEQRKSGYKKKSLILTITDDGLNIYRNLPQDPIAEPIINAFTTDYDINYREIELEVEQANPGSEPTQTQTQDTAPEPEADTQTESQTQVTTPADMPAVETEPPSETHLPEPLFTSPNIAFPGDILRDRPVILLLHKPPRDRFGTTLQLLSREIYHQYEGGTPRGRIHDDPDELERKLQAGGHLEFVDESNGQFFNTGKTADSSATTVNWERIKHRLQELDTQGFGFLIFQLPTDTVQTFRDRLSQHTRPHRPQIIEMEPYLPHDEFSSTDSYLERAVPRAEALWGYPDLQPEFNHYDGWPPDIETFDDIFTLAERRAWQRLQHITTEPLDDGVTTRSPAILVNRHQAGETGASQESTLHYALKTFVVRWLIEAKGYDFTAVATERDTQIANKTDNALIPDVQVGNTVYEVETLYGTGMPAHALTETVNKYRQRGYSPQITIVLPPQAAFLHYTRFKRLEAEMNEAWDLQVTLTVPVIRDTKLAGIDILHESLE